ncbi:hypothetical protein T492DRAFT_904833 [Pavlovales sp. CCMP2436]|nr:hypothetical protein T492DRAFT_904833 [Pavlovales sp. CCMP2436]
MLLPLHERLAAAPQAALTQLAVGALGAFALSDRSDGFVYRQQDGAVYYFLLNIQPSGTQPGPGQTGSSVHPPSRGSISATQTGGGGSVSGDGGLCLSVDVFGLDPPESEMRSWLAGHLRAKLDDNAFSLLLGALERLAPSRVARLSAADISLLSQPTARTGPLRMSLPLPPGACGSTRATARFARALRLSLLRQKDLRVVRLAEPEGGGGGEGGGNAANANIRRALLPLAILPLRRGAGGAQRALSVALLWFDTTSDERDTPCETASRLALPLSLPAWALPALVKAAVDASRRECVAAVRARAPLNSAAEEAAAGGFGGIDGGCEVMLHAQTAAQAAAGAWAGETYGGGGGGGSGVMGGVSRNTRQSNSAPESGGDDSGRRSCLVLIRVHRTELVLLCFNLAQGKRRTPPHAGALTPLEIRALALAPDLCACALPPDGGGSGAVDGGRTEAVAQAAGLGSLLGAGMLPSTLVRAAAQHPCVTLCRGSEGTRGAGFAVVGDVQAAAAATGGGGGRKGALVPSSAAATAGRPLDAASQLLLAFAQACAHVGARDAAGLRVLAALSHRHTRLLGARRLAPAQTTRLLRRAARASAVVRLWRAPVAIDAPAAGVLAGVRDAAAVQEALARRYRWVMSAPALTDAADDAAVNAGAGAAAGGEAGAPARATGVSARQGAAGRGDGGDTASAGATAGERPRSALTASLRTVAGSTAAATAAAAAGTVQWVAEPSLLISELVDYLEALGGSLIISAPLPSAWLPRARSTEGQRWSLTAASAELAVRNGGASLVPSSDESASSSDAESAVASTERSTAFATVLSARRGEVSRPRGCAYVSFEETGLVELSFDGLSLAVNLLASPTEGGMGMMAVLRGVGLSGTAAARAGKQVRRLSLGNASGGVLREIPSSLSASSGAARSVPTLAQSRKSFSSLGGRSPSRSPVRDSVGGGVDVSALYGAFWGGQSASGFEQRLQLGAFVHDFHCRAFARRLIGSRTPRTQPTRCLLEALCAFAADSQGRAPLGARSVAEVCECDVDTTGMPAESGPQLAESLLAYMVGVIGVGGDTGGGGAAGGRGGGDEGKRTGGGLGVALCLLPSAAVAGGGSSGVDTEGADSGGASRSWGARSGGGGLGGSLGGRGGGVCSGLGGEFGGVLGSGGLGSCSPIGGGGLGGAYGLSLSRYSSSARPFASAERDSSPTHGRYSSVAESGGSPVGSYNAGGYVYISHGSYVTVIACTHAELAPTRDSGGQDSDVSAVGPAGLAIAVEAGHGAASACVVGMSGGVAGRWSSQLGRGESGGGGDGDGAGGSWGGGMRHVPSDMSLASASSEPGDHDPDPATSGRGAAGDGAGPQAGGVRLRLRYVVLHACTSHPFPIAAGSEAAAAAASSGLGGGGAERGAGGGLDAEWSTGAPGATRSPRAVNPARDGAGGERAGQSWGAEGKAGGGGEGDEPAGWSPQHSPALRTASAAAVELLRGAVRRALPGLRRNLLWHALAQLPPPAAPGASAVFALSAELSAADLIELSALSLALPLGTLYGALAQLERLAVRWEVLAAQLCALFGNRAHRWHAPDGREAVLVASAARPTECAALFREGGRDAAGGSGGSARLVRADVLYNAPAGAGDEGAPGGGLSAAWDEAHESALGQVVDLVCVCLMRGICV